MPKEAEEINANHNDFIVIEEEDPFQTENHADLSQSALTFIHILTE